MKAELFLNGEQIDLNDQSISLNIQNSELSNTSIYKANYSDRILIPRTSRNERVLQYLGVEGNQSTYKKQSLDARLIVNGMPAISRGIAKVLKSTTNSIELVIYSGSYTLYEAIKDLSLRDLDLSSLDHNFSRDFARGSWANTDGIIYPVGLFKKPSAIEYDEGSSNAQLFTDNPLPENKERSIGSLHPHDGYEYAINRLTEDRYPMQLCYYEHTLFEEIISAAGFVYSFPFFNSADFKNKVITSDRGMLFEDNESVLVNEYLPQINQWDFVKEILSRYGIVFKEEEHNYSSNSAERSITFKKLNDILIDDPDNWSDRFNQVVDNDYNTDLASKNYFEFDSGEQFDYFFESGNDKSKDERASFYKSIYPEPEIGYRVASDGDYIRTFEVFGKDNKPKSIKPHVFSLRKKTREYAFTKYELVDNIPGLSIYVPTLIEEPFEETVCELTFEDFNLNTLAEDHYSNVISSLKNGHKVNASMFIRSSDLVNEDLLKPKYIEQLGGSYYVEGISNYIDGVPVKVLLSKIDNSNQGDYSNQNPIELGSTIVIVPPATINTNPLTPKPIDVKFQVVSDTDYFIHRIELTDASDVDVNNVSTFQYRNDFDYIDGFRKFTVNREDLVCTVRINKAGNYNLKVKLTDSTSRESIGVGFTIIVN